MSADAAQSKNLKTPLYNLHVSAGARMVAFAGYEMPVQYPLGVMKEHLWTREKAGLFDVSHMGQAALAGPDRETVAKAAEALMPADFLALKPGQIRYSQLLSDDGGILDDLMVRRPSDDAHANRLWMIVNAACKDADYAHIKAHLPSGVELEMYPDRALLSLQGPLAAEVLASMMPGVENLGFMRHDGFKLPGSHAICRVMRSGYTGEDGYEIGLDARHAPAFWTALLQDERVEAIGLGARDSLRLEAGLCLYGNDIDTTTSPVEADLVWSIQKRRRSEGGFPGADRIKRELAEGPGRRRVGIAPEGRAPAREGTEILNDKGEKIGTVTSGGFGPTVARPIAMGYVKSEYSPTGTPLQLVVRGKALPAKVVDLPFTPHRYYRKKKA